MVSRPYEDLLDILTLKEIVKNQVKEKIFASWILEIDYLHGRMLTFTI